MKATPSTYATKWFVKRLPGAMIADNLTFLLCAPLADGLVAVANEEAYVIQIVDVGKDAAVRTIRRDYRRVKYEPEKPPDRSQGPRRLSIPRDHYNDIQKLFAVDGQIWALTSTLVPGRGSSSMSSAPAATISTASTFPCRKGSACTIWPAIP